MKIAEIRIGFEIVFDIDSLPPVSSSFWPDSLNKWAFKIIRSKLDNR